MASEPRFDEMLDMEKRHGRRIKEYWSGLGIDCFVTHVAEQVVGLKGDGDGTRKIPKTESATLYGVPIGAKCDGDLLIPLSKVYGDKYKRS